jgi:DNA polymerase sigma
MRLVLTGGKQSDFVDDWSQEMAATAYRLEKEELLLQELRERIERLTLRNQELERRWGELQAIEALEGRG